MTDLPITPAELDTLSADDRAFLMDAWAQLTPDQEAQVRVLTMLTRGVVRHDTAGVHAVARGWPKLFDEATTAYQELLDASDARSREFVELAREFRADAATLTASVSAAVVTLQAVEAELDLRVDELRKADEGSRIAHANLAAAQEADRRHVDRLTATVIVLAVIVAGLLSELAWRLWAGGPGPVSMTLSLVR